MLNSILELFPHLLSGVWWKYIKEIYSAVSFQEEYVMYFLTLIQENGSLVLQALIDPE